METRNPIDILIEQGECVEKIKKDLKEELLKYSMEEFQNSFSKIREKIAKIFLDNEIKDFEIKIEDDSDGFQIEFFLVCKEIGRSFVMKIMEKSK